MYINEGIFEYYVSKIDYMIIYVCMNESKFVCMYEYRDCIYMYVHMYLCMYEFRDCICMYVLYVRCLYITAVCSI
jgi:hypothetical protein